MLSGEGLRDGAASSIVTIGRSGRASSRVEHSRCSPAVAPQLRAAAAAVMFRLGLEIPAEDQWYYLPVQEAARAMAGASPSHQVQVLLCRLADFDPQRRRTQRRRCQWHCDDWKKRQGVKRREWCHLTAVWQCRWQWQLRQDRGASGISDSVAGDGALSLRRQ